MYNFAPMFKKFRLWLIRRWRWYRHRMLYVIADARDNSITLSRSLFDMMDVMNQEQAKVFVFTVGKGSEMTYAFALNPKLDEPTQLCDIQYNGKHRSIGFETLCPTVNRIFYDYNLPHDACIKLSVEDAVAPDVHYYKILRPQDA